MTLPRLLGFPVCGPSPHLNSQTTIMTITRFQSHGQEGYFIRLLNYHFSSQSCSLETKNCPKLGQSFFHEDGSPVDTPSSNGCTITKPSPENSIWMDSPLPLPRRVLKLISVRNSGSRCPDQATVAFGSVITG